ncbi:hypothetical protein [Jiangella alkaliphila]|uniref:N-acetylmuramoyl-L-alanine amidase n=1 Tax=Jiangella alkaliphila TaxID=419479 RepID=A0A1H2L1Q6_9ACTN|nr:hypothetical protein [Jiangella alkaliphila]SDU74859.1 hypothetical protein SAMN04488563_4830 [Jiangella alkaliphila]
MKAIVAGALVIMLAGILPASPTEASADAESTATPNSLKVRLVRDGVPVAGDVVVDVWPTPEVESTLQDGDAIPTRTVGVQATGSDGVVEIVLDPAIADSDQELDLEINVADHTSQASWFLTLKNHGGTRWLPANYMPGQEKIILIQTVVTFDLATGLVTDPSMPRDQMVDLDGTELSDSAARAATTTQTQPRNSGFERRIAAARGLEPRCPYYVVANLNGLAERFAVLQAWSGAPGTINQGVGVDHTLGVAFQPTSGQGASFGGSIKISHNASSSVGGFTAGGSAIHNRVNYKKYNDWCNLRYVYKPISMHSLLTHWIGVARKAHNPPGGCTPYTSGTHRKGSAKNVTFTGGIDVGPISVSAQSGWNVETNMAFVVRQPTNICGNTSSGWVSSPLIDVRSR